MRISRDMGGIFWGNELFDVHVIDSIQNRTDHTDNTTKILIDYSFKMDSVNYLQGKCSEMSDSKKSRYGVAEKNKKKWGQHNRGR